MNHAHYRKLRQLVRENGLYSLNWMPPADRAVFAQLEACTEPSTITLRPMLKRFGMLETDSGRKVACRDSLLELQRTPKPCIPA